MHSRLNLLYKVETMRGWVAISPLRCLSKKEVRSLDAALRLINNTGTASFSVSEATKMPEQEWPEPLEDEPAFEQLNEWGYDGVVEATDGCRVEPDGTCEHGYPSWFLYLELI